MLLALLACRVDRPADERVPVGIVDDSPTALPGDSTDDPTHLPGDSTPDTDPPPDTGTPEDTGFTEDELATYTAFFDTSVLHEVRITLSDDSIKSLNHDGRTYVPGDVVLDGTAYDNVGVRLKGSSTYQNLNGKAAFKIKLDEYDDSLSYGGLNRVTLNNMIGDSTQSKEVLNWHVLAQAGRRSPKASYAQVYVNDELYGLYTNLESMDHRWLRHTYPDDDDGDLWGTGSSGADFDKTNMHCGWCNWDLKSGDGNLDALVAVKEAIDASDGDFRGAMDSVVDVDDFLEYWAWNVVIGNDDGYPWHTNDIFLYGDPADGRFDFTPWGIDESFDTYIQWSGVSGRLGLACTQDATCKADVQERICADLDTWDTFDAAAFADGLWTLSGDAVTADPRRPFSAASVSSGRADLADTLADWSERMRHTVGC